MGTVEEMTSLDTLTNVAFGFMNDAVSMYIDHYVDPSKLECALTPTGHEYDVLFLELTNLRMLIERITKDFLFTQNGMNTTDGDIHLGRSMADVSDILNLLAYGSTAHSV